MPYPHFLYAKQQSFYLAKPLRVQIISICITTITKKKNTKLSIANKSRCLNTFLNSCSIWENKKIKQISDYFARINSLIRCWQQLAQMPTEESLINRKQYLSLEKQNSTVGSSEDKKVSSCLCSMKDWLSYKVHVQLSYSNLNNIKERGFQYSVLSLIITESYVQVWVY